jgi:hypothetical protein
MRPERFEPLSTELPLAQRASPVSTFDPEKRTVDVVFSTGSTVRRVRWQGWDTRIPYDERIVVSDEAINMERLNAGAPILDSHSTWSTRSQVAVVEKAWIEGGNAMARVRFPSAGVDEAADRMFGLVKEGIIRNVSVGYTMDKVRVVEPEKKGDVEQWIIERWTPHEISFVTVPADAGAQTRDAGERHDGQRLFPAIIHTTRNNEKEFGMPEASAAAVAPEATATETRTNPAAQVGVQPDLAAERQRSAEIMNIVQRHGLKPEFATEHVSAGTSLDAFRALVLDQLAAGSPARALNPGRTSVEVINPGESPEQLRAAMVDGIILRATGGVESPLLPKIENAQRSREFANVPLLELCAEMAGIRNAHRMPRARLYDELTQRSMLGTTDYPLLLSAAANKFLLAQYSYQVPTYRAFSAKKTFNDFKAHHFLRAGDFPILEQLTETGEFRNGSLSENREQVFALTYGKIVSFSRQMFVNDDLSAFSDMAGAAGRRVADFENSVAWGVLLSNSKAGPTMSDTGNLYNATAVTTAGGHANLAGAAAAVTVTSISAGRLAMRQQKSLDGVPLNINPSIIVSGPAKQTEIEQLLSVNLLATQISNVNPFNGGGLTRLTPAFDAYITDNAWYLFGDPAVAPAFVYGYVSGYEGPRFAIDQPFRQDGFSLKVAEDFGFGAVDWRPTYRNAGG